MRETFECTKVDSCAVGWRDRLGKLLADAEDCDLIGNLATDVAKRATFRRLAEEFRQMARELQADIDARIARQK